MNDSKSMFEPVRYGLAAKIVGSIGIALIVLYALDYIFAWEIDMFPALIVGLGCVGLSLYLKQLPQK